MKVRYNFAILTREQKSHLERMLMYELERQDWYCIVYLELWKTEGLITTQ